MIKYYFKSIRKTSVEELDSYKPGCWVHAEAPSESELRLLIDKFNLDDGHLEDALDEDEMPRLETEGDQVYIFVRYAYSTPEGEVETMPLLLVFSPTFLITISLRQVDPILDFAQGKVQFNTTQRAKLVLQILDKIVDKYDVYITKASKQIKTVRQRLRGQTMRNQDFVDFVVIEDELNDFLADLGPTNAMLRRMMRGRHIPLFDEDQDIIEDLLLNNDQSIEACNANIKSIINIREAYSSINSNNLNRSMQYLTLVTVIFAVPNMFFGMYGMNIGLPFQEELWAYSLVALAAIAATAMVLIYARVKKLL